MTRKVSLNIPEKSYEGLSYLSEFYGQDIRQTILGILEAVGSRSNWITYLSKDYKVSVKPVTVLADMLDMATSMWGLCGEILEKLQAKGLFMLEEVNFDLDENSFTFCYNGLSDDLYISNFYLTLSAPKSLEAYYLIGKVSKKSLEKLKQVAEEFEAPLEFTELEEYSFWIEDEDEEFLRWLSV